MSATLLPFFPQEIPIQEEKESDPSSFFSQIKSIQIEKDESALLSFFSKSTSKNVSKNPSDEGEKESDLSSLFSQFNSNQIEKDDNALLSFFSKNFSYKEMSKKGTEEVIEEAAEEVAEEVAGEFTEEVVEEVAEEFAEETIKESYEDIVVTQNEKTSIEEGSSNYTSIPDNVSTYSENCSIISNCSGYIPIQVGYSVFDSPTSGRRIYHIHSQIIREQFVEVPTEEYPYPQNFENDSACHSEGTSTTQTLLTQNFDDSSSQISNHTLGGRLSNDHLSGPQRTNSAIVDSGQYLTPYSQVERSISMSNCYPSHRSPSPDYISQLRNMIFGFDLSLWQVEPELMRDSVMVLPSKLSESNVNWTGPADHTKESKCCLCSNTNDNVISPLLICYKETKPTLCFVWFCKCCCESFSVPIDLAFDYASEVGEEFGLFWRNEIMRKRDDTSLKVFMFPSWKRSPIGPMIRLKLVPISTPEEGCDVMTTSFWETKPLYNDDDNISET